MSCSTWSTRKIASVNTASSEPDKPTLDQLLLVLQEAAQRAQPPGVDPELGPASLAEARACGRAEGLFEALDLVHQFAHRYGRFSGQ